MLSNYSASVDLRHAEMWVQSCHIIQFLREDVNLDIFETFLHFPNLLTLEFWSFSSSLILLQHRSGSCLLTISCQWLPNLCLQLRPRY